MHFLYTKLYCTVKLSNRTFSHHVTYNWHCTFFVNYLGRYASISMASSVMENHIMWFSWLYLIVTLIWLCFYFYEKTIYHFQKSLSYFGKSYVAKIVLLKISFRLPVKNSKHDKQTAIWEYKVTFYKIIKSMCVVLQNRQKHVCCVAKSSKTCVLCYKITWPKNWSTINCTFSSIVFIPNYLTLSPRLFAILNSVDFIPMCIQLSLAC